MCKTEILFLQVHILS